MSRKPEISIIIATHNNAAHLEECLDSILGETFDNIEVIVVDVLSTDGTKDIIADAARADERIVFLADSYGSIGHAKNLAIDRARAPYILIVEPEDYIGRHALEYMYSRIEESDDAGMHTCEIDVVGDDSFGRTREEKARKAREAIASGTGHIDMESRLFRMQLFDSIAIYRSDFLRDHCIRHYDTPGYGRQDIAFRFLALSKLSFNMSDLVTYYRRMDITEPIHDEGVVRDLSNEYSFLERRLRDTPGEWWKWRLVFWQSYYDRGMLLYDELSDDIKPRLSGEMRRALLSAIHRKEFAPEHFDAVCRDDMELLLASAGRFDAVQIEKEADRRKKRDARIAREERTERIGRELESEAIERAAVREDQSEKVGLRLNRIGLMEEMARDMAALRLLMGLSPEEMGSILGMPVSAYRSLETGKKEVSWDQFMALLFVFRSNERTQPVTDVLGLYPEALKLRHKQGIIAR